MTNQVAALGYGFHLPESMLMLDVAANTPDKAAVRQFCLDQWPQPSVANKEKMWNHLARRFLQFDEGEIATTPFLSLYKSLLERSQKLELLFYQLCQSTPLILEVLRSLTKNTLLDTGAATFTKYHLDQILEAQFGHVTKSTSERVRQILCQSGRMRLEGKSYVAMSICPCDAVLGFGLYSDAARYGWRSPSTTTVISQSDVMATFLSNRAQLITGLHRLTKLGHVDFHTHGSTDQIQLVYKDSMEFVDAWSR